MFMEARYLLAEEPDLRYPAHLQKCDTTRTLRGLRPPRDLDVSPSLEGLSITSWRQPGESPS